MEIYYTPNTTQIDLTTHHNFTCSIPPWYINIGYGYVQWLRTTWEYTNRHRSPPLLHTVTSHLLKATSGDQTLTPADASPHWLNTLYTRYVIASTSGMTSQRWHLVTRAWPISRSEWLIDLTYIQVRVIDWHVTVLVTGHLAADGGTSGVTSHGDVTEATPGDVTGSTSYHVTHSRPIRSRENIQSGSHLAADGWTDFNMETIRNGDVTGSTSYHVTPSRPIGSLENIQNTGFQAALYTTSLLCLLAVLVFVVCWLSQSMSGRLKSPAITTLGVLFWDLYSFVRYAWRDSSESRWS